MTTWSRASTLVTVVALGLAGGCGGEGSGRTEASDRHTLAPEATFRTAIIEGMEFDNDPSFDPKVPSLISRTQASCVADSALKRIGREALVEAAMLDDDGDWNGLPEDASLEFARDWADVFTGCIDIRDHFIDLARVIAFDEELTKAGDDDWARAKRCARQKVAVTSLKADVVDKVSGRTTTSPAREKDGDELNACISAVRD